MNRKQILSTAFVVGMFATTFFSPANLFADWPDTDFSVIVTSASGAQRHLVSYGHKAGRAGLAPGQVVTVTLQFLADFAGKPVGVGSLDGGKITTPSGTSELYLDQDGMASVQFHAGSTPGRYRVMASVQDVDYWLEFYVLDIAHPERNPPRVRIVE